MILWIVLAAMTAATLFAVLVPMLRRAAPPPIRSEHDMAVYRDQLREVEHDVERGLIGADEAAGAKAEIGRRMLAVADEKGEAVEPAAANTRSLVVAGVAAGIPIVGLLLYINIGSPKLPGQPLASRTMPTQTAQDAPGAVPGQQQHELDSMVARLAERMKQNPDDAQGWMMLGRSYSILGRFDLAVEAFERADKLGVDDPVLHGNYGLALVMQAQGNVPPAAVEAFKKVLQTEPGDARARFYLGMAKAQSGDAKSALTDWIELEKDSPPGSSWLPALKERIAELASKSNIDAVALAQTVQPRISAAPPAAPPPMPMAGGGAPPPPMAQAPSGAMPPAAPPMGSAPRGPTREQMDAAQQMAPEDRMAMIRGMVEGLAQRLEAEPNDVEGWLRLGRSYAVLDEPQKSVDAFARAAALAPARPDILNDHARALLAAGGNKPTPAYVDALRKIMNLDPNNAEMMYRLGLAEADIGNKPQAIDLLSRLLARMGPQAPMRGDIQRRIDQLKAN